MSRPTPRLDRLRRDLARALDDAGPGARSALALELARENGIGHQTAKNRLSRILAGHAAPKAEDTLFLLEWLGSTAGRTAGGP